MQAVARVGVLGAQLSGVEQEVIELALAVGVEHVEIAAGAHRAVGGGEVAVGDRLGGHLLLVEVVDALAARDLDLGDLGRRDARGLGVEARVALARPGVASSSSGRVERSDGFCA